MSTRRTVYVPLPKTYNVYSVRPHDFKCTRGETRKEKTKLVFQTSFLKTMNKIYIVTPAKNLCRQIEVTKFSS